MTRPPEKVKEFADAMVDAAAEALGLPLDFTPETLPFLDHYLSHFRDSTSTRGPGSSPRRELLDLVAPMAGAYFGEVVRRSHGGRWVTPTDDPSTWRLELEQCFLYFNPMGVAVETFLKTQMEEVPGSFQVMRDQRAALARVLDAMPRVRAEDYYTFTVRWETLDTIAARLVQDKVLSGDEDRTFSAADYRRHIELDSE
jgi:hypothetical protein